MHPTLKNKPCSFAAAALVFFLMTSAPSTAQTRGILGYDSGTDSGFLRLFGTNGNSASRLWVSTDGDDRGRLELYDNGSERALFQIDSVGQGFLRLRGSGGNDAARLTVDDADDAGILWLYHSSGEVRANLEVDGVGQGVLVLDGSDNVDRARLTIHDDTESGYLRLRGEDATPIVEAGRLSSSSPNEGSLRVLSNGVIRANLWSSSVSDAGHLFLYNDGNLWPSITLNGATGDILKSGSNGFLVAHPKDPEKEIFYTSLEGPERGMYVRGTATLEGGKARIELPEHFSVLARADGMSVQLTPGSAETYGLAAVRKTPQEIHVQELADGKGSFSFDYIVYASRKDLPPLEVVRKRTGFKAGPADTSGLESERKRKDDEGRDSRDREPVDSGSAES